MDGDSMTLARRMRKSLFSRGIQLLITLVLLLGAVMLYLLSGASANTPWFSGDLPLLLAFGVGAVLLLMLAVGYQLLILRRRLKARVFGSKLTLRLVLLFALVAVLPGALVYAVSVQFLSRSIESWFDVRVEKALEGGLSLGRANLDNMLTELQRKAESMSLLLSARAVPRQVAALNILREQAAVNEATLFRTDGSVVAFSIGESANLAPDMPSPSMIHRVRMQQPYRAIEALGEGGLQLRVLVPVNDVAGATLLLQLMQPVPASLTRDAQAVQEIYRDYQELSLSRLGLNRLYAMTLTLSLLLALLSALLLAIVFSGRLSAPLGVLAAGTRAVAQGDFSQRKTIKSQDELGLLTESFNIMTMQLAEAQADAQRNQGQVAAAKAYLESLLGNLSAGVLSFDAGSRLRSANRSAEQILGVAVSELVSTHPREWADREPRLAVIGNALQEAFLKVSNEPWETQVELSGVTGPQVLLLRVSTLPAGEQTGMVVVFDDITRMRQAQRLAAWGEVAQRLAHEIKNPLTPIQLSAERLQQRLADKLAGPDAEILNRLTQTIVNQVGSLKALVDAFTLYARSPEPQLQSLDLNLLTREVVGLYESSSSLMQLLLAANLPLISGDPAKLRQVIHNLLQNAEHALADIAAPRIVVKTEPVNAGVLLTISDNGPGFPEAVISRAFEPYVTTKARGTGLGLAIVKKIVEEHNGSIAVANAADGGAIVSIVFPLAQAQVLPLRANRQVGR